MTASSIPHPLSDYARPRMIELWTPEWNVIAEREWWLMIMNWMKAATRIYDSTPFFNDIYASYVIAKTDVDLDLIREREHTTKHDVKARIEEFNHVATQAFARRHPDRIGFVGGLQLIHLGMTSADVVDNISLIRIREAASILWGYANEPARHILEEMLDRLPLRGIKGPVGTQQDMLDLLGSVALCDDLDRYLADEYGFNSVLGAVGQVYSRSIDLEVASAVAMAVQESENKRPWLTIVNGYMQMIANYSGDQWQEGDVSTSAVRRVALPGLFLAADAAMSGREP